MDLPHPKPKPAALILDAYRSTAEVGVPLGYDFPVAFQLLTGGDVTLLAPNDDRTKVGVRALLIGVGRYPHLKDGKSKIRFDHAGDIGRFTEPPRL